MKRSAFLAYIDYVKGQPGHHTQRKFAEADMLSEYMLKKDVKKDFDLVSSSRHAGGLKRCLGSITRLPDTGSVVTVARATCGHSDTERRFAGLAAENVQPPIYSANRIDTTIAATTRAVRLVLQLRADPVRYRMENILNLNG